MTRIKNTRSKRDLATPSIDVIEEKECIIAHLPYLEDTEDAPAYTEQDLVTDIDSCESIPPELRIKLLSFIRTSNKLENKVEKKCRSGGQPQEEEHMIVHRTTLPVKHLDHISSSNEGICCWWCCHEFDNPPVYLPHSLLDDVFHVTGFFCSFNCALSYNISKKDTAYQQRATLLWLMYNKVSNIFDSKHDSTVMIPAPPRELLQKFGGWMTIDCFRRHSLVLGRDTRILIPPLQSVFYTVESIKRPTSSTYPRTKAYVPLDHEHVVKARETLKLKRNAPRKTNYVSLEETMGIIKRSRE